MVKLHFALIPSTSDALQRFLGDGWKGYHNMRGRVLSAEFEERLRDLKNPECTIVFYNKETYWDDRLKRQVKDDKKTREGFILEADALLSRLVELSFDLDFEE